LRQDIERSETKNSAKRKIQQVESTNNHSTTTTGIIILEKAFTTENRDESIEIKDPSLAKYYLDPSLQKLDQYSPNASVFIFETKLEQIPKNRSDDVQKIGAMMSKKSCMIISRLV
jgi:hypothetical protein